jgi:hypothetical protein
MNEPRFFFPASAISPLSSLSVPSAFSVANHVLRLSLLAFDLRLSTLISAFASFQLLTSVPASVSASLRGLTG